MNFPGQALVDMPLGVIPGRIIAEFDCGTDARSFCRMKGPGYTVTPGITHCFAVRALVPAAISQLHGLRAV